MPEKTGSLIFSEKQFHNILKSLIILGSTVSLCFTVQFCLELGGRGWSILPVLLGFFCEGLKYVSASSGLRLIQTPHKSMGYVALVLSLILILGSVTASVGYMVSKDSSLRKEAWESSSQFETLHFEKIALQKQITSKLQSAEQDTSSSFRSRGLQSLKETEALQEKLFKVNAQLLKEEQNLSSSDFFSGLASLVQPNTSLAMQIRMAAYFILAFVLEMGCLLSLQLLNLSSIQKKPLNTIQRVSRGAPSDILYNKVREAILSEQVRPAYKEVRSAFNLGQEKTIQIFQRLKQEGVISKEGLRFVPSMVEAA